MIATNSMKQLDRKIVECSIRKEKDEWVILRERTDKNTPNHVSTADAVMSSIRNPVTKDMLIEFCRQRALRPDSELNGGKRKTNFETNDLRNAPETKRKHF